MLDIQGKQPGIKSQMIRPTKYLRGDVVEPAALRFDTDLLGELTHSKYLVKEY